MVNLRIIKKWIFLSLILLTETAGAQVPLDSAEFRRTDLFTARSWGYFTYRIPGLVMSPSGTILAHCEARKNDKEDRGDIDIVMARSEDNGLTWQMKKILDEGTRTVNNLVGIADRITGRIHFLYNVDYRQCYYMYSDDDGLTFSRPRDITPELATIRAQYNWESIGFGTGHGIQLRNGRLIAPFWMKSARGKSKGPNDTFISRVCVVYSDDHGKTWTTGAIVDSEKGSKPTESTLVQLTDGRVMINSRNEMDEHRRLIAYSSNNGNSWTKPFLHQQLLEPISMGSIIRLSTSEKSDKNRILFVNPHNLLNTQGGGKRADRKSLSIKVSYDEGETWSFNKVLEEGLSGYADLAVGSDGSIFCFYERGGVDGNMYDIEQLTIAQFNLTWLTDGADGL